MAVTVGTLLFKIEADTKALRAGMDQAKSAVGKLQSAVKTFGGVLLAAFSVNAVINFGKEAIKLGGQMEGVRQAFDRLNKPDLLDNLRKATRGTVTDLQLMQYAVRAENFKIPLTKLATFFEFATKRATQTGESVDYLVNSIITGIGRKSSLVMDNLGISATEMQDEFKKMGDFGLAAGNIIERELLKMGDVATTTNQKLEAMNTSWTNMNTAIGEAVAPAVGKLADEINTLLSDLNSADMTGLQKFISLIIIAGNPSIATAIAQGKENMLKTAQIDIMSLGNVYDVSGKKIGFDFSKVLEAAAITGIGMPKPKPTPKPKPPGVPSRPGALAPITPIGFEGFDIIPPETINQLKERAAEVKGIMIDLTSSIQSGIQGMISSIASGLEGIFSGDFGLEQFFKIILQSFGHFMQQMGTALIAYGIGMEAFKKAFANPAAAIAAGAALIAIGSVIAGLASRGPTGGGGGFDYSSMYPSSGAGSLRTIKVETESITKGSDIYQISKRYGNYHSQVT